MSIETLRVESAALRGNPLGDPHVRKLPLIVPDDLAPGETVPCLWYLAGYGGIGATMLLDDPWQEGLEERLIRLRRAGRLGKMIVALPDAFTRWGGSQYITSSAHGDYERYLVEDLPRAVEARYPISAHAIAGKSSGGFGALVNAMRHPERYVAVASHSGDIGFRLAYHGEILALAEAIQSHGSLERLVAGFDAAEKKRDGRWIGPISALAMAAAYSPDPRRPFGIAIPFDVEKADLDDAVFARWLAWDPLSLLDQPQHVDALRRMRLVYVDCGTRDEYHLHWGARAFSRKLQQAGVPHRHEEFDDTHRNVSYRLDVSLPLLYSALVGAPPASG
ncbi:MAG: esterase [Deltaproteobacteria bacterium]|nr:esterase [Deltaproteobacteria bacterium]